MLGPDPAKQLHAPVLLAEAAGLLSPGPAGVYCDATIGFGGHARAFLEASAPDGRLIGIDRDQDALEAARENLKEFADRLTLVHAPFGTIGEVIEREAPNGLDGLFADLGVSSPQLDRAERGFSFKRSGPLDMRMDRSQGETAAELIARIDEGELEVILRDLGEERHAHRIARAIVDVRDKEDLSTTGALATLVARAMPGRERHKDPATRTFQALRIAVNGELEQLEQFLNAAPACMKPGGRVVVIAFHSLEDRLVKHRMRAWAGVGPLGRGSVPTFRLLTKKAVVASEAEQTDNPRSRSAKLRAAEKLGGPDRDLMAAQEAA